MWDRTRENLINILQVPAAIRNDSEHEMWSSWNDEKLKSRQINLATIKSVLQRQNRYQVHDLEKCDDCQQLFDALEEHKVWTGGDPSKRSLTNNITNKQQQGSNSNTTSLSALSAAAAYVTDSCQISAS